MHASPGAFGRRAASECSGLAEADELGIVGESPAVWQLRSEIAFIGPRKGHVLVQGGTGTGKELVANALHAVSGAKGSFVARNAATLPESLVDAEQKTFRSWRGVCCA